MFTDSKTSFLRNNYKKINNNHLKSLDYQCRWLCIYYLLIQTYPQPRKKKRLQPLGITAKPIQGAEGRNIQKNNAINKLLKSY
jgi:hypothetical protein